MRILETRKVVSLEDRIPKLKQRRKKKANRRAIILLSLFFVLLILVLYFLSPLSNVSQVKVEGNRYLSKETIIAASGISSQTSIWKLNKKEVKRNVKKLPEIKSISLKISLPNTVQIEVDEYERMAYLVKGSSYHPILASGKFIEPLAKGEVPLYAPLLIGYEEGKALQYVIEALEELPEEINNAISEIHHSPTKTDEYHVTLYMNDGYEVSATSRTLASKLVHYPSIVSQIKTNAKGVIDLEVGSFYREYQSKKEKKDESKPDEGSQE